MESLAKSSPGAGPSVVRKAPEHLNSSGLRIEYANGKGRGVYACREIPAQTLIEVSPVLLFSAAEYEEHGKHTVLDHYTFKWRDGRMALALGLGSLFNHSQRPNVSYTIDTEREAIRYTTTRRILPDEELCIFYGHKLWFDPVDAADCIISNGAEEREDGWGGLANLTESDEDNEETNGLPEDWLFDRFNEGKPHDNVPEEELPFTRLKLTPEDVEEEDMDSIRKEEAWVVDLPDPKYTATMLKWLKQSGFDTPTMAHLKRLKSALWPTIYAPRKKYEPEPWSRGKVRWACEAMKEVVKAARAAGEKGELPIAAYVPVPFDEETKVATRMFEPISAHDLRRSACHPLRHCIINLVRAVGELRASSTHSASKSPAPQMTPLVDMASPSPNPTQESPLAVDQVDAALSSRGPQTPSTESQTDAQNGAHYLLTSLTLFTTHEPCIMCSMALLHSRVKEVFYLFPMEKTGGCGSVTCVPRLEGVNHRYAVNRWKLGDEVQKWKERSELAIDEVCDA
ncbi:hypothetical protein ONZ51_g7383 [Trametes cubensis]|uniref:SET domain-containing protein n=1 Tax=Trametes cubensis TaxID=1111947 RepID=A0AAD7TSS5_9APHY|nr:hypothetical protein ONZ51_g7383 [Trametes cubensis]